MAVSQESKQSIGDHSLTQVAKDLKALIEGDVRFDTFTRAMFATDASIYRVMPIGVVMPKNRDDVRKVVEYAHRHHIPILPRGGGTSLAGQAVNEAIVIDFTRYMNRIIDIDPRARLVRVEPGVILAHLNDELKPYGLKFAPDPNAGNRSAVCGAIGNNSSGAHSLVYGKTDVYLESLDVVLANGEEITLGEVSMEELEQKRKEHSTESRLYDTVANILESHGDEIERVYPKLKRNVSGYNLANLVLDHSLNLSRLIAGSEGTLAVVVEAVLRLEPLPNAQALALLCYSDLIDAMKDVYPIVQTGAAAVEVMDDVLLNLARETTAFGPLVDTFPKDTHAALVVEYYADTKEEARSKVKELVARFAGDGGRALTALEAYDRQEQQRLWKLREAGVPILLKKTGDEKHIAFIEDVAVPPQALPEYVRTFQAILNRHVTGASFYAHAGPGVLHVRPLINTKDKADIEKMVAISQEVTALAKSLGGAVSGEHGDGRARTQWNRPFYGERLWQAFLEIKEAFDPKWLLNPGQVVYRDDAPTDMTEHLRAGPDRDADPFPFEPVLNWENELGMPGMVDLCHGCGGCRTMSGGVMCPTYRVAQEEIASTRGRANLLREAMTGGLPEAVLYSEQFHREVLDLCIGCKGCIRDCPSGVDMTKLKAEVKHAYHQRHGIPWRDRIFGNVPTLNRLGSALAPLSNYGTVIPGVRRLMARMLGITDKRPLPSFQRETFEAWYRRAIIDTTSFSSVSGKRRVKLFVDCHTNHTHTSVGKAAVQVLYAAGVEVELITGQCCGRAALSKGMLDLAKNQAESAMSVLKPHTDSGSDIVALEPSCVAALQEDGVDLIGPKAKAVAARVFDIMEYLDHLQEECDFDLPLRAEKPLQYHGHCHQKAQGKEMHAPKVLERTGFDVQILESSCCGMAGSFGYEVEHYDMSMAIGQDLFKKIEANPTRQVVAPGASCTAQILHGMGIQALHPVEVLAAALIDSPARDQAAAGKDAAR